MAMHDWNGNGKNDFMDDFFEFNACNESENTHKNVSYRRGISNFGAIVATILGLIGACAVMALFGVEEPPIFLTIILWIVIGAVLTSWFDRTGF